MVFSHILILFSTVIVAFTQEPVHFNEDGSFKIVTFTDLHYGEGLGTEWGPNNDRKSTKVMEDILGWEHPDFVAFTGDLLSAEVMYANGSVYVDTLLGPVVRGNYSWASTYGNHDIGNNVTREEILATEQKYERSFTRQGEPGLIGTTNYYVPVYPPKSSGDEVPALILWFFDTRGGRNSSGGISAYVHETVVEWFKQEVEKLKSEYYYIPSLAFFHYPTAEYSPIHEQIKLGERPECPGQHDDIVTPQERDTGFMEALAKSGIIKAAFVGHNHGNAWCCGYKSIDLCYNRQSGHGGGWVGWTRGSRVINLNYNKLWAPTSSYIRLENGTTVDFYEGM